MRTYLTEDEIGRVLVTGSQFADRLLVQMGLSMGCRVSEITSLLVRNIKGQEIKIWDEKKDDYRTVFIDSRTSADVGIYLLDHYEAPVGVRKRDRRLFYVSDRTINRRVKAMFKAAEIPEDVPYRWHTLRHTYVRRMFSLLQDNALQFICEQTGDSPATILGYYGIPSFDERRKVADNYRIVPFQKGGVNR